MFKGVYALYRQERDKGLSYREIAEKYGVSRQNVCQACRSYNPSYFRFHKKDSIIYPSLRDWMNDKKISINELVHRLGMEVCPESCKRVSRLLKGTNEFRKPVIDKLIALTGIPYEILFSEE